MKYRYYRNQIPSQRDVVKCRVVDVNIDSGVNVVLVDYNDIPGFVPISHYIRNIKRSKKIANKDDDVTLEVYETTNDLIMLTKMNIRKDEIILSGRRHKLSQKLGTIANDIFVIIRRQMGLYGNENKDDKDFLSKMELCKERISELIIWDNIENYFDNDKSDNEIYDDLLSYLQTIDTCEDKPEFVPIMFEELVTHTLTDLDQINDKINEVIAQSFRDRIVIDPGTYEVSFSMITYNDDGVNDIKHILTSIGSQFADVEVYALTSPKYLLQISHTNSKYMTKQLSDTLEYIKHKCNDVFNLQIEDIKNTHDILLKYNKLPKCDL